MGFFLLLCLATLGLLLAAGVMLVRALFWIVLLPFRLVLGLLFFPIWIAKSLFKLVGLAIAVPIMAVAGGLALVALAFAALVAVIVPLAPILLVGGLLYVLIRAFSRRPMPIG